MKRYALRTGEYLAISSDSIRRDSDGFFLMLSGDAPANETRGTVTLVNIRGALQQFTSPDGDSYECILNRVAEAMACDPKPSAVVLRISSPGGVVAGLNETVFKLRRMSKDSGIPLIAYVDELAASAAYALCCACEEVLSPPSGVCGSIGVISTMVSVAEQDQMEGIAYRIITSGKRKADGHIHEPISEDAVKAETSRNAELASQFFDLASKARKIPTKKLASLEANIFLGKQAEKIGLVDDVLSLDDMLLGLDKTEKDSGSTPAPNRGNITDRRAEPESLAHLDTQAKDDTQQVTPSGEDMSTKLNALIAKLEASIASEQDQKKLAALQARKSVLSAAKAEMDDDDKKKDKDSDDDDEDESKAMKAAKKAEEAKKHAEAAKHRARAAEFKKKAEEAEEEAKKAEEDDEEEESEASRFPGGEEEARAALEAVQSLTGMQGAEAIGAIRALAAQAAKTAKDVAVMKAANLEAEKSNLIQSVSKASTKQEREFLASQPIETVRGFVKMRLSSGFVSTSEDQLYKPKHVDPTSEESLPEATRNMIDAAVHSFRGDEKAKAELKAKLVKNHLASATNGARY